MKALSLDPKIDITAQLDGGQGGPVVFVALFHVPAADADKLMDAWYGEEEFLRTQPGFVSRELVRGRGNSDVFIDYAKWTSAAQYRAALLHPDHVKLLEAYGPIDGNSALHLLDPTEKPSTLPVTIQRFLDALNRGDSESLLPMFSERAVVVDVGRRFASADAIREWNASYFVGGNGTAKPTEVLIDGSTVTLTVDWKSNFYVGPSKMVFLLDRDLVVELHLGP